MKKIFAITVALFVAACGIASAASYGGLKINKWSINSIRPTSFTSVDGSVKLSIVSERRRMEITNISGTIYNKAGEAFIIGTADDVVIRKGENEIVIYGHGGLSSYSALLGLLGNFSLKPENYTADIYANLKEGRGPVRQVEKKGIPLSAFLGK